MPTPMKISTLLRVLPDLPVTTSVLLRGDRGIGKSSIVRDVNKILSEREGKERPFVDRRLSTMQGGDLMGLPSIEGRTTRWNPPDWFKLCCERACDLHLDEFNRAELELLQASFQIVLDRQLNGFELHPGTRVYASINVGAVYNVQPIDPALLSRFWVADVVLTKEEWVAWARENGVHPEVIDWIDCNEGFLLPVNNKDPKEKGPDPRSIERMSRAIDRLLSAEALAGEIDRQQIMTIASGFVGTEATASFLTHLSAECRWTGLDVLQRWSDIRSRTKLHRIDVMRNLLEKVTVELEAHETMGKLLVPTEATGEALRARIEAHPRFSVGPEKMGPNVEQFLWDCQSELRPLFFQMLARYGLHRLPMIKSVHPFFVKPIVTGTFGVPVGPEGRGILPRAGTIGVVEHAEQSEQTAAE